MGTVKENINKVVSAQQSSWIDEANERQANLEWSKRSFKIAVRILREIREQRLINGMTQRKLAEKMGVTPQYINKVVKGKENLTLETIAKIEQALGITLIEVPSFNTKQMVDYEGAAISSFVNRNHSIPIGEDVRPYSNSVFTEATGAYG